jgi:hypothetical protein
MLRFQGGVSIPLVKGGVKAPPAKCQCRAVPKAVARRGFTEVRVGMWSGCNLQGAPLPTLPCYNFQSRPACSLSFLPHSNLLPSIKHQHPRSQTGGTGIVSCKKIDHQPLHRGNWILVPAARRAIGATGALTPCILLPIVSVVFFSVVPDALHCFTSLSW